MARPQKIGLDYFSVDCDFLSDDKFVLLQEVFGDSGPMTVIRIWGKLYKEKGYYKAWGKHDPFLISHGMEKDSEFVSKVVEYALEIGLFDKKIYEEYGILTSEAIQKMYLAGTVKRKKIIVKKQFWLLSDEDLEDVSCSEIQFDCTDSRVFGEKTDCKTEFAQSKPSFTENKSVFAESKSHKVKKSKEQQRENERESIEKETARESSAEKCHEGSSKTVYADQAEPFFSDSRSDEAFRELLRYRRSKKIGNSERAVTLLLNKLMPCTPEERVSAIETTIERGWRSVFPDSGQTKTKEKNDPFRNVIRSIEEGLV